MKESVILKVIEEWTKRKINGKKFNKVFQVDGIPIWYFLEPLTKGAYLPRPFKTLMELEGVKSAKFPKFGLKSALTNLGLRKGLWLNEKIKWSISSSKAVPRGEKDVLFLCYTNQVVKDKKGKLKPVGFSGVIDALKDRGVKQIILFCDPLSKNSFKGLLKFPSLLYSYITPKIIKESDKISRDLNQKWKKIDIKKKANLFTFRGKCYWRFLKDEMNFFFSKEMLATLMTYYLTFKKIIQDHKIKVVYLVSLGGFYESLLLGAAYKLDRKVVHSPHGYGDRYFIVREELVKKVSFVAAGNEDKNRLRMLGVRDKNIFITGSPFFDEIAEYRKRRPKKTKKTVVLLTGPVVEDQDMKEKDYLGHVRRFLSQISKVRDVDRIVIKLHPREKLKRKYESLTESLGLKNVKVTQALGKEALYSILSESDLLISYGSTTDIEGLVMGKDVVNIDGLKRGLLAELAKRDKYRVAVVTVDKNGDLAGTITKILTDKSLLAWLKQKRREYVADYFYKVDGRAHERVADRIKSLVEHGRTGSRR